MIKLLTLVVSTILFLGTGAHATELLGAWNNAGGGGGGSGIIYSAGQFTPGYLSLSLGYSMNPGASTISSAQLSSGTTGTFDYNGSNASNFGVFVQHLTNTSDETLWSGITLYDKDHASQGGGASGNPESFLFPPFAGLTSWQPEFVRLVVRSLDVHETTPTPGGNPNYGYSYSCDIDWQIWGTVQSVPEPATLLFLGLGVIGLTGLRRKTRS